MVDPAKLVAGGRYELEELVGQGGYGGVYRALDRVTGKPVAVKVLTAGTADDPHGVERMVREQQALVALSGTSAVSAVDLCCLPSGALCLVMEWLPGVDLERRLTELEAKGERFEVTRVLALLEPVVNTLARAHEVGIVHRDIKPANIFLTAPDDEVRLLDFGLARIRSQAPLTAVGMVMGSPSYIAPEAWRGNSKLIDHRADLYSLGVVAFRMLSGCIPFEADTLLARYSLVTTAPRPSLQALRPDLPPAIDDWVGQTLAVRPELRFNTARAWYNALASALLDRGYERSLGGGRAELSAAEKRSVVTTAIDAAASLLKRFAGQWQGTTPRPHRDDSRAKALPEDVDPARAPFAALPGMEGVLSTPAWPTSDPTDDDPSGEDRKSFVSDWLRGSELDQSALRRVEESDVVEWLRGSASAAAIQASDLTSPEVRALSDRLASTLTGEAPDEEEVEPPTSADVASTTRASEYDGFASANQTGPDPGAMPRNMPNSRSAASSKKASSKKASSKKASSKKASSKKASSKKASSKKASSKKASSKKASRDKS